MAFLLLLVLVLGAFNDGDTLPLLLCLFNCFKNKSSKLVLLSTPSPDQRVQLNFFWNAFESAYPATLPKLLGFDPYGQPHNQNSSSRNPLHPGKIIGSVCASFITQVFFL